MPTPWIRERRLVTAGRRDRPIAGLPPAAGRSARTAKRLLARDPRRTLGEVVAQARAPKLLAAATRLAPEARATRGVAAAGRASARCDRRRRRGAGWQPPDGQQPDATGVAERGAGWQPPDEQQPHATGVDERGAGWQPPDEQQPAGTGFAMIPALTSRDEAEMPVAGMDEAFAWLEGMQRRAVEREGAAQDDAPPAEPADPAGAPQAGAPSARPIRRRRRTRALPRYR